MLPDLLNVESIILLPMLNQNTYFTGDLYTDFS